MATTAAFFSTPRTAAGYLSAANTGRDGTGTVVTVMTGAATGTRIDDIDIIATAATTAGVVRLFLYDGSTYYLWREILVQAVTPSTSVAAWSSQLRDLGLILESASWSLRATTNNAETFNVLVTRSGDA